VGAVRDVLTTLAGLAEKEGIEVHIVGGFVRDALRGVTSRDVDMVVSEEAEQFAKRAAWLLRGDYELLESQSQYSRVTAVAVDGRPVMLDFSLRQGMSIAEDLAKRDFTVNAIGVSLPDYLAGSDWVNRLVDPCGGADDLQMGILRITSPECLRRDPVRLFRAARFTLRLGFTFAPETERELRINAPLIRTAQKMKLSIELFQLLSQPYAADGLRILQELEILQPFFPPFYRMAVTQSGGESLFTHGLRTIQAMERIVSGEGTMGDVIQTKLRNRLRESLGQGRQKMAYLRLACLLHDIGKIDGGSCGEPPSPSFNHEIAAEAYLVSLAKRLCLQDEELAYLANLVCNHSRSTFLNVEDLGPRLRFFRQFHNIAPEMFILAMANHAVRYGHETELAKELASLLDCYLHNQFRDLPEPFITSREIMEFFNLPPVRAVGDVLEKVYCAQINRVVKNRTEALNMISKLLDERQRSKGELEV
jgi:poly(A) polymerase